MAVVGLVESGDKEQLEKKLEELKAKNCAKELYERNLYGHSPIDLAALLGREDLLQLLLDNGVEVNSVNKSGYTPMHYSAAWGQLTCLSMLAEKEADCFALTHYKETPKAMAERYGQSQCVNFLSSLEQFKAFEQAVSNVRSTLSDSEKIAGKWNKEDRSKVNALCNEKSGWLEKKMKESTLEEMQQQQMDFELKMEPFLAKLGT